MRRPDRRRVTRIEPSSSRDGRPLFEVVLGDGQPLRARRLIVTTGLRDSSPPQPDRSAMCRSWRSLRGDGRPVWT